MSHDNPTDRWRRISALFDEAVELPAEQRGEFLGRACGADTELRRKVEELLEAAERSGGILDRPALTGATELVTEAAATEGGETLGPYRLLQKVGEGGMGEVWLAEQQEPVRRRVALKVIKAGMDSKQVIARFEAERQALALMDHPAIAKVLDAGTTPRGLPYFVMEHVQGDPITDYCDRHKLSVRERLELFDQVCDGVQHAHQKGIIHRDLKPSNVLVTIVGEKPVPKIIDFGVAKATAQRLTERTLFTELGVLIGTPEYMSPEQAELTGLDVDTRTDVYALGVMLYELLTGSRPFESRELREAGLDEIRRFIREVEPPRPSTKVRTLGERSVEAARNRRTEPGKLSSGLRGDLDWIVMRALEKDRTRRYGSPGEFRADIERHLRHEPVVAGPPSTLYRARKFVRRHRFGVAVATVAAVGVVGFALTMAAQARRIARERDRAERVSEFLVELFKVSDPSEARGNSITAREVLDRGAERIEKQLSDEPELQAQLMHTMGEVYIGLGLYAPAERLLRQAVDLLRVVLGPEHPRTLRSMHRLADVYGRLGRFAEAERVLVPTLEARRRVLGPEHLDTLASMNNLANLYLDQGRRAEGASVHEQVLEISRRVLGPEHPRTLMSMRNVANAYTQQGRFDEAIPQLQTVEEVHRRVLGPDHPSTLTASRTLAHTLASNRQFQTAYDLMHGMLEQHRRVLGPEHTLTIALIGDSAWCLNELGRYAEAEPLARQVLEAHRRDLGPEHPDTLSAMINLAFSLMGQGRYAEAVELRSNALEANRRVLGPEHPRTLGTATDLAEVYVNWGRLDEARQLLRETIETERRVEGADYRDASGAARLLARADAIER